jgi:NADPH:quinone reductase-like Zn-dependent oxidoreductase
MREVNHVALTGVLALLIFGAAADTALAAGDMRAAVIVAGGVQIQTLPKPEPKAGEVRIKVRYASVNPTDWKRADHSGPGTHGTPGRDLSGVIDAVGPSDAHVDGVTGGHVGRKDAPGVSAWKVGEPVIAIAPGGSYSEYAIAPVSAIAAKPARMSFEEAAGIGVVGETAWRAMVTVANVQAGQRVLIHGGAGGVGSSAVQIAKARGAYVIATASPSHNAFLRSLGADEVLDYNTVRFEDKVKGVDAVLNTVDPDITVRSLGVLKPGGILVSVVGPPPTAQCEAAKVRCGVTGSATGEMLHFVSDLASQGKFHIHIDQQLPLADAAKAWEMNRKGHTAGKIVLAVSP